MPAVRWAYKAIYKNLSAKMIPKMTSRVEAVALGKNPHAKTPISVTTREDQSEEIM